MLNSSLAVECQYFEPIGAHLVAKIIQARVSKTICGHHHRNSSGWYEDMEFVVTSADGAQFREEKSGAREC